MPTDANERGSQARSASESGRKPPRPSSKTRTASSPDASTPPPQASIWLRRLPGRASSTRPRCFMPRRSVSSDASRPDSPANSRAIRHQVSGVWISRDPSVGCSSPQKPGRLSRRTSSCMRGLETWASERMASTALRKAASWPDSSAGRRSSTVRLSRRPAAISRPSASSQGAPSSTAALPRARTSRPVASITSADGPWPRRNRRQVRATDSPAPLLSARPDSRTR